MATTSPGVLQLFPSRITIGYLNGDRSKPVMMSAEFFRALQQTYLVLGGADASPDSGDTFDDIMATQFASVPADSGLPDMLFQSDAQQSALPDMLFQQAGQIEQFVPELMQPFDTRSMSPRETVTVGASPYTYTANRDGYILVSAGTVTQIDYTRRGTATNTGVLAGMFPILVGDSLTITHGGAPTAYFIPR